MTRSPAEHENGIRRSGPRPASCPKQHEPRPSALTCDGPPGRGHQGHAGEELSSVNPARHCRSMSRKHLGFFAYVPFVLIEHKEHDIKSENTCQDDKKH
jgi:hypothetical protein